MPHVTHFLCYALYHTLCAMLYVPFSIHMLSMHQPHICTIVSVSLSICHIPCIMFFITLHMPHSVYHALCNTLICQALYPAPCAMLWTILCLPIHMPCCVYHTLCTMPCEPHLLSGRSEWAGFHQWSPLLENSWDFQVQPQKNELSL